MQTSLFDYHLLADRIAQKSIEPRDHAKLLVMDRETGELQDRHIFDLPDLLAPGDLLVMNNSKVFKARLTAHRGASIFEIFLLRPNKSHWLALAQPAKKLRVGDQLTLINGTALTLVEKNFDGTILIDFQKSPEEILALTDQIGEIPIPPYVKNQPKNLTDYQTIYAEKTGSVAAPTAGFHFTTELLQKLKMKGIKQGFVTLHVGLGTFRPMKTETLEEHKMHEEWVDVPEETRVLIEKTKQAGHRVIAIGTTTVRALESDMTSGFTQIFITPGYSFKKIDGLLTNFHLPKSTLLVLVSAFSSRTNILRAYQHAMDHEYRFYSFGDAMLII
ncbi:tRNA preQ1(34) S-adenosylmethionine ribosyltransferase-isomerase QueA [Candidatus Uhrbacteria bacterium]|nr:tRNA preQ1(34) S-adenosylmethionine ribosyltransferase-isomerase QueA [Candidatus Uhrbacteria bacterium]